MSRALVLSVSLGLGLAGSLAASQTVPDPAASPSIQRTDSAESNATLAALLERVRALIKAGKAAEALALLMPLESEWGGSPDFDYLLGSTALANSNLSLAVNALERVILVQPSYAGAWLDLAITHALLGEHDTADRLLQHLEENFELPQLLRADIAAMRRKILTEQLTKGWRSDLSIWAGTTNNANYGPAVSSLRLTPGGGETLSLILAPSYRPRSDNFTELRGLTARSFLHDSGRSSEVQAGLRYRGYNTETAQNLVDTSASWIIRSPIRWAGLEGASLFGSASWRYLNYDQQSANAAVVSGGLRLPLRGCYATVKVDIEQRSYSDGGNNNATIPWLGAGAECRDGTLYYAAQQRFGRDEGRRDRPGGASQRAETLLLARWQARPNLQLDALVYYARSHDADPYSPLLADGERRWTSRLGQKLEAVWVVGDNPRSPWAIVVELEHVTGRSNIGLNTLRLSQILIGLSYRYF